nr:C-X-C motif chemokine 16 isoform X2 [Anolis sagrei ordinatus]XP_060635740.1 C-X-C motif chemokine 16 isoform X2 [Anolis sagrei ordinatus]
MVGPWASSRRGPSRLALLLPLLLWPVFGNEGGTAGSCNCRRKDTIQPDRVISRVKSWGDCQQSSLQYVQFFFPNFSLCVPLGDPGAERLKELISQKENARVDASKGDQGPPTGTPKAQPEPPFRMDAPPTSKGPPTAQPDPRFSSDAPRTTRTKQEEETPATQGPSEPPLTPGAAVGQPGRPPTPQQGSGPGQSDPQPPSSSHPTVAIVSLLGIVLILVAVVVFLICRKRRRDGTLHPAVLGEEIHRLNLPEKT